MGFWFVGKQVSRSFRYRPTTVATNLHSRHFLSGVFEEFTPAAILMRILNKLPHTATTTAPALPRRDDPHKLSDIKVALNIPGIEKTKETDQGLSVFLDTGMGTGNRDDYVYCDTDVHKQDNALFIKAFLQNHEVRKNFRCRVNLPDNISFSSEPEPAITTEVKDGCLVITVPKQLN